MQCWGIDLKETQKVAVRGNGKALLQCPYCQSARIVDVGQLPNCRDVVKVRCVCRQAFCVSFEWRKACREETHLDGLYFKSHGDKDWGKIVVRNMSATGIGFKTLTSHTLHHGDKVKVSFALAPLGCNNIEKSGVVKVVKDKYVGCELLTSERSCYLGPQ
jgi:hypothetical protein